MTALTDFLQKAALGGHRGPDYPLPIQGQLVGLELEVDQDSATASRTVFPENFRPQWTQKRDGSLNNGYEYVLSTPLADQQLVDAVYQLFSGNTCVHRTYTGSTHIHLNMLDGTTLENLQALALLTYAMEGLLYYVGDNSRQWCGYANRMTGAPNAVMENILGPSVQRLGLRRALNNAGRYYGLNLAALEKYGTVEFRYFPTATSAEEMLSWVKLVQQLKKAACDMGSVQEVLSVLSDKSKYSEFVSTYLSEYSEEVDAVCSYGKVKILANKALVIANVPRSSKATWNKELLSSIFFKQPIVASNQEEIVPKNVWFYQLRSSSGRPLLSASQAMNRAIAEGKDSVLLDYDGSLYAAYSHSFSTGSMYDWVTFLDILNVEGKQEFDRYIAAAERCDVDPEAINRIKNKAANRVHRNETRHERFVPFSPYQDTALVEEDEDDYSCYASDEEEDF